MQGYVSVKKIQALIQEIQEAPFSDTEYNTVTGSWYTEHEFKEAQRLKVETLKLLLVEQETSPNPLTRKKAEPPQPTCTFMT